MRAREMERGTKRVREREREREGEEEIFLGNWFT